MTGCPIKTDVSVPQGPGQGSHGCLQRGAHSELPETLPNPGLPFRETQVRPRDSETLSLSPPAVRRLPSATRVFVRQTRLLPLRGPRLRDTLWDRQTRVCVQLVNLGIYRGRGGWLWAGGGSRRV